MEVTNRNGRVDSSAENPPKESWTKKQIDLLKDLSSQVREDWETTGRDWTKPGFRALALHRCGNWAKNRHRVIRTPGLWFYTRLNRYIRNHYGIDLPLSVEIGRRTYFANSGINIHANSVIGDGCIIRQRVTLGSAVLDRKKEAPVLHSGVEIGPGTVIFGNIEIGEDVRIGPNAVVMTNVPAGASVFGNPARIIPDAKREKTGESTPATEEVTTKASVVS